MKTVTLQFCSLDILLEFREIYDIANCKIHSLDAIIICDLGEAQLRLAMQNFGAKLIQEKAA